MSDYIQHLEKSKKPSCKVAYNELKQRIQQSHFLPHDNPPLHPHSSDTPQSHSHVPTASNEVQPPSGSSGSQFVGDFFAEDYTSDDFPGFEDVEQDMGNVKRFDDEADEEDEEDDDNDDDDEGDELQAGQIPPELEGTWEPHREPVFLPNEADLAIVDDLSGPVIDPLLRRMPAHREDIHVQLFGGQAGAPIEDDNPNTNIPSSKFYDSNDGFQHYESCLSGIGANPWAPFSSRIDWEVARWAKMQGTGSTAFSDLLAIDGLHELLGLSYCTTAELNHIIDTQLPSQRPPFSRQEVVIAGEAFDFYKRPILDCIRSLYGSPNHAPYLCVSPERHYSDANRTNRLYHDMYTGKWWWSTQKQLEKDKPGATIVPVIISSDKTQVTLFRNKSAYPVYLTIGNLPKEIRRKPSQQGQILLAYLPTTRLQHISNKAARRRAISNLFHACMKDILSPLKEAGEMGVVMESGDGVRRRCHPILASYVGDYPEQILVTCGYYGDSPICMVSKDSLGSYPCTANFRDPVQAAQAAKSIGTTGWVDKCEEANIKPVQHPFWEDLPYTDIFRSITPDILHQLYQGVMKHLIEWLKTIVGPNEIDARVRRLPPHHGLRHFSKGISSLSRVSGAEHKQMCSFLLSLVVDIPKLTPTRSHRLFMATRSLLDFLYQSRFPIHSDQSLAALDVSLATFHEYKDIFVELGAREHFNLPKIHFLCHYVRSFKLAGTSDNYNTETTERLHIDFTKDAYRASNRKDEYSQMTKWLERREKIGHHTNYINWKKSQAQAVLSVNSHDQHIPGVRYDFPGSQRSLFDMRRHLTLSMAKHPTAKSVPFSTIEDTTTQGYGAVGFELAIKCFIAQFRNPEYTPHQVEEMAIFLSLPFRRVPVWHKLKFRNEELYGKQTIDSISSNPRRFDSRGQVIQASRFDTALIRVQKDNGEGSFLQGLQVGCVRVIFSLPTKKVDQLFARDNPPPAHLAYVEWFTKFTPNPDQRTGLYHLKPLLRRDKSRAVSVIPLEMIQQSVYLYPRWGGSVPSGWTHETILDSCHSFFLSPFTDTHMYFNMYS
ncbi:hypothetical protein EV360DRAFT_86837 [Lentinula raphanica]|nr:hypothetical protein EV360DRAFT_86837 [Lentinula raphanica]